MRLQSERKYSNSQPTRECDRREWQVQERELRGEIEKKLLNW